MGFYGTKILRVGSVEAMHIELTCLPEGKDGSQNKCMNHPSRIVTIGFHLSVSLP